MTQTVWQRIWITTQMGDENSSLGRSCNQLNWTMDGQSQQQKG